MCSDCRDDLFYCWHLYGITLDGGLLLQFFLFYNLWQSKFMALEKTEKIGKLKDFFFYTVSQKNWTPITF